MEDAVRKSNQKQEGFEEQWTEQEEKDDKRKVFTRDHLPVLAIGR